MTLVHVVFVATSLLGEVGASPALAAAARADEDNRAHEIATIECALGVDLVVVNESQLNLPYFLAGKYHGGLCVVIATGPLAKVAGLKPGDKIVALDGAPVTSTQTALGALERCQKSLERTKLTILRGNNDPISVELLLMPATEEELDHRSTGDATSTPADGRSSAELVRQYHEARQLMYHELVRVEELQRLLPGPDPRQAEAAVRRKLEALAGNIALGNVGLEKRLADVEARLADAMAADKTLEPRVRTAAIDALVQERDMLAKHVAAGAAKIEEYHERSLHMADCATELETRQQRVRVLQQAVEKSIRAIRLAQAQPASE